MSKKTFVPPRILPLQRIVAQEITDPAERVAIDRMRKRLKRKQSMPKPRSKRRGAKAN